MDRGSWKRWLIVGVIGVALLVVGGPFVYFNFIAADAPPPLTLSTGTPSSTPTTSGGAVSADGTWKIADGSVVGYRIKELLFGQSNEAVGRTSEVSGSVTIDGTIVTGGTFTVKMASVASDENRRDNQFRGRIMNVSTYPTATFKITQPITLGTLPSEGVRQSYKATGELTMHGVTKTVTFDVAGRLSGSTVQVAGAIPITFADYDIGNPSFGPAQTEDHGVLEFALNVAKS